MGHAFRAGTSEIVATAERVLRRRSGTRRLARRRRVGFRSSLSERVCRAQIALVLVSIPVGLVIAVVHPH